PKEELEGVRFFQDSECSSYQMQTPRDKGIHLVFLSKACTKIPRRVDSLLYGTDDLDLGPGIQGRPPLREAPLGDHLLNVIGVVLMVDKVALVPGLLVRDVCAEDGAVERRSAALTLRGGIDVVEEVGGLCATLL